MKLGKNRRFSNTCQLLSFLAKLNFLKVSLATTLYLLDFIFLDLHLVYFIVLNFPVTREWDAADWLDPLFTEHSSVNLSKYTSVLKIKLGVQWNSLYTTVYCRVFSTIYIMQRLVLIRETVGILLYIILYSHYKGNFKEGCSVKYTVYLSIPLMVSVKSIV